MIADRTAYDVRYVGKLSNRFRLQVDLLTNGWYARSDSTGRAMNAPKLNPLKRGWPKFTNSVNNRERNTTSEGLISVSKTSRSRFHWVVFSVRFVAKRYILQQKCLNRQIGTCLLETLWYNFYPCTPTLREPRCTDLHTVKRTDGRHDNANNRSKRCDYTV